MSLSNKKIFLAGATGLAGSSILKVLLDEYPSARLRVSYHRTPPFLRDERVEYVHADLRSLEDCRKLARGCDCAIMAAAMTSGANILVSQPWKQVTDNLLMNAQMLESFHLEEVRRIVFISSASIYQEHDDRIKESDLDLNKNPHPAHFGVGWVYRYLEKLCEFWHRHTGMDMMIARASNIYGPFSRFDPAASNFIPAIIRKAVDHMDPFEVWGDSEVTRDVIYCEDFARAIVVMLDNDRIKFDVFNIGSGEKTTVGKVVELSLKYCNHTPVALVYLQDMPTTIRFRVLNCSKARETFGWHPRFSVEEGLSKTIRWWIDNKNWWNR